MTTIYVVMKAAFESNAAAPVEAHTIEKVADSRAKHLNTLHAARFLPLFDATPARYSVVPIVLNGSETVAVFPGVNTRVQVEEPRKTPRRQRAMGVRWLKVDDEGGLVGKGGEYVGSI